MNILLFSGSHSRHLYFFKEILNTRHNFTSIIMERESLFPKPPNNTNEHDIQNFTKHFSERNNVELDAYGNIQISDVFDERNSILCSPKDLNSEKIKNFINTKVSFDLCIVFGSDLIKKEILDILPDITINLHLGISPYFRGSATLFWPFYFLMPQFAGATFHKITENPDAGEILHHSIPNLEYGDKLHDIGAKTVIKAASDMRNILNSISNLDSLKFFTQRKLGGLFLMSDFHPSHLRVIYDLYDNKIVDFYLNGELLRKQPKVINLFN